MVDRIPDPVDRAYNEAEKLLQEEAERSARRARVLAAVARDSDPRQKPVPRFASRGGWLVAASLVVVSGFLVTRFSAEPWFSPLTTPAPVVKQVQKNEMTPALSKPAPAVQPDFAPVTPQAEAPDRTPAIARRRAEASGRRMPEPPPAAMKAPPAAVMAAPSPAASPPPAAPPPSIAAAPRAPMSAPLAAAPPPPPPAAPADMAAPVGESGVNPDFDQLRRAAAAGRTEEVQRLLDRHVPVDAAGPEGETALMKSIRADQSETAALLIRHGASLDKKNNAGFSARDLAAQVNDPALNHALGLAP